MSDYITRIRTATGDKQIDYRALANLPKSVTDVTDTVISPNADYAEVGEWADGNPADEDRLGYFVAVADVDDNTIKIRKATSEDDVRGVTVYNPAFSGNASDDKYGEDGELLQQYNYVGVMGIVQIIDNGTCEVNGRCMPADDGTAIPSSNNMGYAVLKRVDDTHVLIAVEPGADMIQRIKADIQNIAKDFKPSPENIIFPDGLKTTYEFGKIKPQNGQVMNIIAPGGTLAQVFDALVDEMNPTTIQPSASITLNDAKAYEVGTTFTPTYTVTFYKGSYSYDDDTGVTETSRTITDSNGKNPPFSAFTVGDTTNYAINVEIDHTEGIVPKTNMGNYYLNGKIQAGTVEATSKAVTGYRNTFYGTLTNKNELTSTIVRGLTKSNKALSNGSSFTIDIPVNALRVVIAYPSTLRDITSIKDVNGLNAEIASGFTKRTLSVAGANNYTAAEYKVYVMDYAKANDKANKYTVTI